jgi:riboflavin synthase
MFTGIVEAVGTVAQVEDLDGGRRIAIDLGPVVAEGVRAGDSVSVSGACLTAVALDGAVATFEAVPETIAKTYLGALRPGERVNLERALRAGDRFGGHFVQGHVDGVGRVVARTPEGPQETFEVACEPRLTDLMIEKGSVALDGVSLTVARRDPASFDAALVPHTLAVTTLGAARPGARFHFEADILAKYVERAVAARLGAAPPPERR